MFQTARRTELISILFIPAFKIHMHGGLRLRRNTGNISVLNHEGELMCITQATRKLCAIVMPVNVVKYAGVAYLPHLCLSPHLLIYNLLTVFVLHSPNNLCIEV